MNNLMQRIKNNSPAILTLIGSVGVFVTGALTIHSTIKAVKIVESERFLNEPETVLEVLKDDELRGDVLKCYIPPAISAAATCLSIIGANYIQYRRNSALVGLLATTSGAYIRYREQVKNVEPEVHDKAEENIAKEEAEKGIPKTEGDEVLFFDSFNQRLFKSTWADMYSAMYRYNRDFIIGEFGSFYGGMYRSGQYYIDVNWFYEFLGLPSTPLGKTYGYSGLDMMEGGMAPWIDFTFKEKELEDGRKYYIVDFEYTPLKEGRFDLEEYYMEKNDGGTEEK